MGEETFCVPCASNDCVSADGMDCAGEGTAVTDTMGGGRASVFVVDVLVEGISFTGDFVTSCVIGVGVVLEGTGGSVGGALSDGVSVGIFWMGFSVGRVEGVDLGSSAGPLTSVAL
jgi:hypothetical protein